jgi:hypothetical protein
MEVVLCMMGMPLKEHISFLKRRGDEMFNEK